MFLLNYIINLLNIFLIFIYFIILSINLELKEFGYILFFLIMISLLIKLYNWYNFTTSKKKNLHFIINNIFFNERFTRLSIFIFSILIPIYMIFQKDSLVINLYIEKFSFLLVFIFSLIGFYLEFFILESKTNK